MRKKLFYELQALFYALSLYSSCVRAVGFFKIPILQKKKLRLR